MNPIIISTHRSGSPKHTRRLVTDKDGNIFKYEEFINSKGVLERTNWMTVERIPSLMRSSKPILLNDLSIPSSIQEILSSGAEKDNMNGRYHSFAGKPASVSYRPNGKLEMVEYYNFGVLHREDGPAKVWFGPSGLPYYEKYYINGKISREDGPAYVKYNRKGQMVEYEYYIDDNEVRKTFGPLKLMLSSTGRMIHTEWKLNGHDVDPELFRNFCKKMKVPHNPDFWDDDTRLLFKLSYSNK